jgi:acetyl-CoA carboxylase biotin carboxyl carrier protein
MKKMQLKELKKMIKLVEKSKISSLKLETDKYNIEISKEQIGVSPVAPAPVISAQPRPKVQPEIKKVKDEKLVAIKSPMVGTFYESSKPGIAAYIKAGDRIKIGQVVCIIEAMKLFNEIESEHEGVVEKVLVANHDVIEYGQELFLIRVE